jgi:hypothetical protein
MRRCHIGPRTMRNLPKMLAKIWQNVIVWGLEEEDGPAVPPPRVFKQPWTTRKGVLPRKEEGLVSVLHDGAQATGGARLQSCRLEPEEKLLCQENWKVRGIIGIVQDSLIGHGKTVDMLWIPAQVRVSFELTHCHKVQLSIPSRAIPRD